MPSASSDLPGLFSFAGQLVVFTGKLSSLGRRQARDLVTRLGGSTADDVTVATTMLVIGAEGFGQVSSAESAKAGDETPAGSRPRDRSNKQKRVEDLNAQGARIRVVTEEEFCGLTGTPTVDTLRRQYHPMRDLLARYRSLREDQLRYLMKCGIIRPVLRTNADVFFEFRDLSAIKQANADMESGASFRSVTRALLALQQGQLAFDFRLDAAPAKIITLRKPTEHPAIAPAVLPPGYRNTALAEEYFRAASALDDGDDDGDEGHLDAAISAYRKALEVDPYLVPALINLANLHYNRDELIEAQALYERAIGLEPDFFEAHFNLGNIYHDLGHFAEAQACYREALRLNPSYAEAHFYLAVTLEKMGLSQEAKPHWRSYRQLAPRGEWVELAKEFSE